MAALEAISKSGIKVAGDLVLEKHVEHEVANVEAGGIGIQIIDDVINLTTGNPGKKRGDDIVEGKKSLPVLIHVVLCPQDRQKVADFMKAAAAAGIESPAVEDCIKLLESSGCIEKAAERGRSLIEQSCAQFHSEQIHELFTSMIPENFR